MIIAISKKLVYNTLRYQLGGGVVNMRNRTRQRGSTSVFIVCAIILVLISLAVLYGVRRIAMNDQTPPMVVPENSEVDNAAGDITEDEVVPESSNTPSADESTDSGAPQEDSDTSQEVEIPVEPETSVPVAEPNATPESAKLPAAGPEDTAMTMLALVLVTSSGVAYVHSRKLS